MVVQQQERQFNGSETVYVSIISRNVILVDDSSHSEIAKPIVEKILEATGLVASLLSSLGTDDSMARVPGVVTLPLRQHVFIAFWPFIVWVVSCERVFFISFLIYLTLCVTCRGI